MTKTSYQGGYGVCTKMAVQADLRPEKSVAVGTGWRCAALSQAGRRSSQCLSFSAISSLCP